MNPEDIAEIIRYRLEQAQTALDDAEYLLIGNRSPQSIINRCYYAMFYAILALLQSINKSSSKHVGVISTFDQEFVKNNRIPVNLSKDIHKAFELRRRFDYKVLDNVTITQAKELYEKAVHFVSHVNNYFVNFPCNPS